MTHDVVPAGHDSKEDTLYLADNAAFAWGLLRLQEVTHDAPTIAAARGIVDFMLEQLTDPETGGLFAATADPNAVGVFARRRVPFADNVVALRVLAKMVRLDTGTRRDQEKKAIAGILRAVSRPEAIKAEGRMIGNFLLALEETRGVRGNDEPPGPPAARKPAPKAP